MQLVIFLERASEFKFISKLVEGLAKRHHKITVASLEKLDAQDEQSFFLTRHLSNWLAAFMFFRFMRAPLFISTAPYLGRSYFVRSIFARTKYFHVVHSLVSLNTSYSNTAFESFDGIIVGTADQHLEAIDANYFAIPYGYEPMRARECKKHRSTDPLKIVIAPSWNGPLSDDSIVLKMIGVLQKSGVSVTYRPHELHWSCSSPETKSKYQDINDLAISTDNRSTQELEISDLMISDVSGIAYEYFLTFKKPVLFFEDKSHPYFSQLKTDGLPYELMNRHLIGGIFHEYEISELYFITKSLMFKFKTLNLEERAEALHVYNSEQTLCQLIEELERIGTVK